MNKLLAKETFIHTHQHNSNIPSNPPPTHPATHLPHSQQHSSHTPSNTAPTHTATQLPHTQQHTSHTPSKHLPHTQQHNSHMQYHQQMLIKTHELSSNSAICGERKCRINWYCNTIAQFEIFWCSYRNVWSIMWMWLAFTYIFCAIRCITKPYSHSLWRRILL